MGDDIEPVGGLLASGLEVLNVLKAIIVDLSRSYKARILLTFGTGGSLMVTKALQQELVNLEMKYWRAIKEKDMDTARKLTDDPCIVAGAQGVATIDRKNFEQMMKSPSWTVREFEMEGSPEVRLLNDDVAIVAYKIREEMTVDGSPVTLKAADASTWVRRNGQWVCAMHTESILGDAFGRDRRLTA